MSIQAMVWAIEQRIVTEPTARHVLLCLANYAGADGGAAFPSVQRLVEDTGLSERTVRNKIQTLLDAGAIFPGNPAIVAAYIDRADRRPMVFNLRLSARERGAGAAPRDERGAAGSVNGVQLVPSRGAGAAPKPSVNRQENRTATRDTARALLAEHGVDGQLADDFLRVREKKRAPLTVTAMDGIAREAVRAGLTVKQAVTISTENSWQGFKAEWVEKRGLPHQKSAMREAIENLMTGGHDGLAEQRAEGGHRPYGGALPSPHSAG